MAITSIVDYLKSQGQDSSYAARKQLATQAGITNYSGTAAQNMNLLTQLQKGSQASPEGASGVGKAAETPSQNVLSGTGDSRRRRAASRILIRNPTESRITMTA